MRILFVCLGNICRSPIAEGIMHQLITKNSLNWKVGSAGTESYHIGEPPHHLSQKICQKHGINIKNQKASKFTVADFERFDKIYPMALDVLQEIKFLAGSSFDEQKVTLFLNELYPDSNQSVPDPYYGPEEQYGQVYDLIEKGCLSIVSKYKSVFY